MNPTADIVSKLWALCHDLRDDGVTYHEYVTELTFLLFLKMADETGEGEKLLAPGCRWSDLKEKRGSDQFDFYRKMLVELGTSSPSTQVKLVYANASTSIRQPRVLAKLVSDIDALDWFDARQQGLGDLYEGLLQKNATESKRGAGQYFTPRPLIDSVIALLKPSPGEVIQDPALGTAGFLVAAHKYISDHHDIYRLTTEAQNFQLKQAYVGMELVPDTHRLAVMNALLHGFDGDLRLGSTLASEGGRLPRADVILTNPPFGVKTGGVGTTRDDFTYKTSNKQLAYIQHIYRALRPGGRAAVVLPDNVLFEGGIGRSIRQDLMDKCRLHTILRLPTGIFYAQNVKTNVLFFERGTAARDNTDTVWIYDLRTGTPAVGRRNPFDRAALHDFELAYGPDRDGRSERTDQGEHGRFRPFTRAQIAERADDLDIKWLSDALPHESASPRDPASAVSQMLGHLQRATQSLEKLHSALEGGDQ